VLHRGSSQPADEQRADEIDLDDLAEEFARHHAILADHAPRPADARAVHRDAEAIHGLRGRVDRRVDRLLGRDVHLEKSGTCAERLRGALTGFLVHVEQRDSPAGRNHFFGDRSSQP
jgi:hypothetical protein